MEHFIPDAWFRAIDSSAVLLLIVAMAIGVLARGADWLVDGAAKLAYGLGIGKVIVGATVVSLGTTSPEASVSVMAAWSGDPGMALGNAIGSIVCDTALVFGLCCLLTRIPLDPFVLNRHGWLQFGSGLLLVIVCVGAWLADDVTPTIPRWVGWIFLGLLAVYLWISIRWAREHPASLPDADELPGTENDGLGRDVVLILIGLAIVIVSSRVLIGSASELALRWHVPKAVVAATIVAFGTSLPELVTALAAVWKRHEELVVGNVIGADILNVLFVAGASAAAAPLVVEPIFYSLHLPVMLGVLALFRIYVFSSGGSFRRWMGLPLLAAYVAYAVLQYVM